MTDTRTHVVMQVRETGVEGEVCMLPVLGHDGRPVTYPGWPEAERAARRIHRETHGLRGVYLTYVSYHPGWLGGGTWGQK